RILPYLLPYRGLAAASAALVIASALAGLAQPWPLTLLVDNVLSGLPLPPMLAVLLGPISQQQIPLLILAVGAGLVITLVIGVLNVITNYVNTKLEQSIVKDFRTELFAHAERLSVSYADQVSTGRMMYGINFEAAAAGGVIMAFEPLAQGA